MELYYNSNGLVHHRLDELPELLQSAGYRGIALTPDVPHLDPRDSTERQWRRFGDALRERGLGCTLESGARFALDPRRKHFPNLVTKDQRLAAARIDYYAELCRRAEWLGATTLSIWSGSAESTTSAELALDLLLQRLPIVLDRAREHGITLCFEPEPEMAIDDLDRYRNLRHRLQRDDLATTLDLGHLIVTESEPLASHLAEFRSSLRLVHLDDARRGVHQHLPLGSGDIDFGPLLAELRRLDYRGPLVVELSRDSHRGVDALQQSAEFLAPYLRELG